MRALQSRNRLLKQPDVRREVLSPYDEQLAELGARLVSSRGRFIDQAAPRFQEAFHNISKGLRGEVHYEPDVPGDKEALLAALDASFAVDARRGFTSKGPHSDDLRIEVNGLMAKRFASQGQQRMAVL